MLAGEISARQRTDEKVPRKSRHVMKHGKLSGRCDHLIVSKLSDVSASLVNYAISVRVVCVVKSQAKSLPPRLLIKHYN